MIISFQESEDVLINKILSLIKDENNSTQIVKDPETVLSFPGLTIYPNQYKIMKKGEKIELTRAQFIAMLFFARHPGQVFSHDYIYDAVHQYLEESETTNNTVYCLIRNLRKKIEPDPKHPIYIHTVRGAGYKFEPLSEE